MKTVWSIFRFVLLDNLRSAWSIAYLLFIAATTYALIHFTGSFTRSMVSIMNVVILLAPLVSTIMTSMYYFNKTDLLYLLLAQPIQRSHVFVGLFLGIATPLCLSLILGISIGAAMGMPNMEGLNQLITLLTAGSALTISFSALSLLISVGTKDKLRGIGLALFTWLFMGVIYDGLLLIYFIAFSDYPIEQHAIILSLMNPIDLSRIFVMLQLDISALMGYSGAVFQKFFGSTMGQLISLGAMLIWVVVPVFIMIRIARRKDY